ncbi:DUF554 domain-containing protein [Desulfobulbus sp.]|uniref:DUF554 domain-containing protein n=1 Tax=Desulfobulbus sp. TaxID=895 RepID=UPI00286F19C6|nr:DUF554 domain-containing protein [Desulfobulbus sp.]
MVGPIVNSAGIIAGALCGVFGGRLLSPDFRTKINNVFGCISLGIGISMVTKGQALPPVILALLFGAILGELCRIESMVMRLALKVVGLLRFKRLATSNLSGQVFRDQFAVLTILFCVSGLGFIGSIEEGLTGDPSLLLVKAVLDFFTAFVFASNIGGAIGILVLPQYAIQTAVLLLATTVMPFITPIMFADFSACGGFIMLGTGLRLLGLAQIPVLSMLPSLLLVMPLAFLWEKFFSA